VSKNDVGHYDMAWVYEHLQNPKTMLQLDCRLYPMTKMVDSPTEIQSVLAGAMRSKKN
jgi:hypothetical protein